MPRVWDRLEQPGGTLLASVEVLVRLQASSSTKAAAGWRGGANAAAIVAERRATTDSAGIWHLDLDANNSISPDNSVWVVARALKHFPATPSTVAVPAPRTLINGAITLPQSTITVDSTAAAAGNPGFSATGTIKIGDQIVTYTGTTASTFTGCTGGVGSVADNAVVTQPAGPSTTQSTGFTPAASGTFTVSDLTSTTGFLDSGYVSIVSGSTVAIVRYAAKTATTLTGCTSIVGGGTAIPNGATVAQAYHAGQILQDAPSGLPTLHALEATGAHAGSAIAFTPAGGIAATTVQSAIAELDTEAEKLANKGQASGYASLDGSTLVPTAQQGTGTANNTVVLRGDRAWSQVTDSQVAAANKDGADGTASMRTLGNSAGQALPGVQRGAVNGVASLDANTRVPTAQLASGTADSTAYLRGDRAWRTIRDDLLTVTAPTFADGATLQAWLDAISSAGGGTARVGAMNAGSSVITVPTNVNLDCLGKITFSGSGGFLFDGHATRRHVVWASRNVADWDDGADTTSIGVKLRNCNHCEFIIRDVRWFHTGVYILGDGASGSCSNNAFLVGFIGDNLINIQPAVNASGWCNSNVFVGGQVRHGSGFVGSTRTITNVAVTSNVATITTSTPHGFTLRVGPTTTISGLTNSVLNGTRTITGVPTSTTFTFSIVTGDIASQADSGTCDNAPYPGSRGLADAIGGAGANNWTFINTNWEGWLTERTCSVNGPYATWINNRWEGATGVWLLSNGNFADWLGGYQMRDLPITDTSSFPSSWTMLGEGVNKTANLNSPVSLGGHAKLSGQYRIDSGGPATEAFRFVNTSNNITGAGAQIGTVEAQTALRLGSSDDVSLTRGAAGQINTDSTLNLTVAGKGINLKEGTNARMGVTTLTGGTVTVNTTAVAANSRIQLTRQVGAGTRGFLTVGTVTAGTSFVIRSEDSTGALAADTSTVHWHIINPS